MSDIRELISRGKDHRGLSIHHPQFTSYDQVIGDLTAALESMLVVYEAAQLLSDHVHTTPTTERIVRPHHHDVLKEALAAVEK